MFVKSLWNILPTPPEPDAVPLNKRKIEEKTIPRNQTAVPETPKNLPQPQKDIQKPGEDDIRNKRSKR